MSDNLMEKSLRNHIETIIALTDEEFQNILTYFKPKRFLKHQFLVQEDQYVQNDYFLTEGLVKSFQVDDEGKEHILQFALTNHWITDVQAMNTGKPASLNIYCIEPTQAMSITLEKREKLCADFPKMQYFFRQKALRDNILLQRRILCLISNNAANRYNDLLHNYPEVIQRVPKTMIASYLGISRETLSRFLAQ